MSGQTQLLLDFISPDIVIFNRGVDLDAKHWLVLVNEWSNDSINAAQLSEFQIPFQDFIAKKAWFMTFWKPNGHSVSLSSALKKAMDSARSDQKKFEEALVNVPDINIETLNLHGMARNLTDEQAYNVAASLKVPSGANFSVPGAGKTTATLALWNHLVNENELHKLLVICPLAVIETWMKEELELTFHNPPEAQKIEEKYIHSTTQVLLTNYEKLENENILNKLLNWVNTNKVMLVIDEAHRIKGGSQSIRWRACKKLADKCSRVDLLTGTPMPQGYDDIRNLFNLSWKNLSKYSLSDHKLKSLKPGGVFVRTTKDELNLPPTDIKEISIEMSDKQKQIYSALRRSYSGFFKITSVNRALLAKKGAAVMSLIAASSNPGLIAGRDMEEAYLNLQWPPEEISENNEIMELINNYIRHEIPPKYKWILKFINESVKQNKKTLIWSSFVGNIRALERLLHPYNPVVICGGVNGKERRDCIQRFKEDPNCAVLITNPHTLGEGISLHKECNQAVYLDRTFNAVHYLQSLDRIHRLGLKKETITSIYILSSSNSIDNRIDVALKIKIDRMANSLNDESLNKSTYVCYDEYEPLMELALDKDDEDVLYEYLRK